MCYYYGKKEPLKEIIIYVGFFFLILSVFVGLVFFILYISPPEDESSVIITNHTNATVVAGRMLVQLAEVGVVAATKILRG